MNEPFVVEFLVIVYSTPSYSAVTETASAGIANVKTPSDVSVVATVPLLTFNDLRTNPVLGVAVIVTVSPSNASVAFAVKVPSNFEVTPVISTVPFVASFAVIEFLIPNHALISTLYVIMLNTNTFSSSVFAGINVSSIPSPFES